MGVVIGKIYKSNNCGTFKVLGKHCVYNHRTYYSIVFTDSNYTTEARSDKILEGSVLDPYYPCVCGVGYLGAERGTLDMGRPYTIWSHMIERCYNPNCASYCYYGALGIKVCKRWHSYANFLYDIKFLPGYDDMMKNKHINYHFDKDVLQQDLPVCDKIYSPLTCMFIPGHLNARQVAIDNAYKYNNDYCNVSEYNGYYCVRISVNNQKHYIGRFVNQIDAVNAANHYRSLMGMPILYPDVQYIPPEEVNSRNLLKRDNQMVHMVDK